MTDDQKKKPGAAFWATVVVLVVLVAYPLSFGPACRACSSSTDNAVWSRIDAYYGPMVWAWNHAPLINVVVMWYANVGSANGIHLGKHADETLYIRPN